MSTTETQSDEEYTGQPDEEEHDGESDVNARPARPKRNFKWNETRDLALVVEVQSLRPFPAKEKVDQWKKIAKTIGDKFNATITYIAAQRHFDLLVKNFKKEDFSSRYKSGKEEEITSIKEKLADVISFKDDHPGTVVSTKKQGKIEEDKKTGEKIRELATSTIKRKSSSLASDPKVPGQPAKIKSRDVLDLWEQAKKAENGHQQQDIQLRKEQLELDRARFEHQRQKEEKEANLQQQRFELEREERLAQIETQKLMLQMLLKKN